MKKKYAVGKGRDKKKERIKERERGGGRERK